MKKIVLVLAVLVLAAPAWADVIITATHEGGGVVRIDYNSPDANVSAFGLDITVSDGWITDINSYHIGESNSVGKGYGIFPGGIVIANGNVTDYNTPVADAGAKGARAGLDSNGITIEMGALYEDGNQPPRFGTLCRVTVDTTCTLSVTGNSTRGNVVLEDANEATLDLTDATDVLVSLDCFPSGHPDYTEWVSVGKPDCWCNPNQCYGDADGIKNETGFLTYRWVAAEDLTILVAGYQKIYGGDPSVDTWICADFDHIDNETGFLTYRRVAAEDLTILVDNYQVEPLPGDCP